MTMYTRPTQSKHINILKGSLPWSAFVWQSILAVLVLGTVLLTSYSYNILYAAYSDATSASVGTVHKRLVDKAALKKVMADFNGRYK